MQSSPDTAPEPVITHAFPVPASFTSDDASSLDDTQHYGLSRGANPLPSALYVERSEGVKKEEEGAVMGKRTPFFDRFDLWFGGGRDLESVFSLTPGSIS